jgi:arginine exporter protein ArgO
VARRVRDRDVLVLAAAIVVGVLAANLLSAAVPPLDRMLQAAPVLVIVLIVGTIFVLVRALGRSRRADDGG